MTKALNYAFISLLLLILAGIPVIALVSLLNITGVDLRHNFWISLVLSILIIPIWIAASDTLEIITAFITKNKRVNSIISMFLSILLLASACYIFLVESFIVGLCMAGIICCLIMAIRPYVDSSP